MKLEFIAVTVSKAKIYCRKNKDVWLDVYGRLWSAQE